ncbi:chymotrypsin-like protease CTRL-1 [Oppia nitens]|uniref:chymotrypsin-like protease CTRL-1 n=1 Tax=Oppia nitens TaxID=1686743 RepID=UPI0023DC219A|nr:chymotrypsin-like protease CTRL-1 [Oppia nitens]
MTTGQCLRWSSNMITSNVQNGRIAKPGEWPWIVLISGQKYYWGFIPTDNFKFTITVRTVQNRRHTSADHTYSVQKRIVHYKYKTIHGLDKRYDIALLKLGSQIPIPSSSSSSSGQYPLINGICLPDKDILNTDEELALVAGFGWIDDRIGNYGPLMMGWIMVDKRDANNDDDNQWDNWFTAHRYPNTNGSAICKGDSGGPVVQYVGNRAVLIGLNRASTLNIECMSYKSVAIMHLMRVSKFVDWIVDTIRYS